jgi:hypothetical protein
MANTPRDGGKDDCQLKLAASKPMVVHDGRIPSAGYTHGSPIKSRAPFREKAGEELREFIVLTAYLYICFAAVIYFKAAVLQAHDVAYAHVGLAFVKAAICAKFMLMACFSHGRAI